ncbi:hypothetical protein PR048_007076 [Dryococelus australis]|uniref:Actin-related protein 5 n=1 Tax=Dryococelus australis TaxID=614101 RepID=A0ABQ9ICL0_9NEOP|nr:hypothetical protein PR048_007076 [Dryococelus australis]
MALVMRDLDGENQVGNDITNIEAVRFQLKSQFDRNVVTHFEAQEQVFDYMFTHLGIDTEGCVNHPVLITEAFLNPNYSRQLMSELLFECYGVPSLAYGVDGLFSFHFNVPDGETGLIVNCGYHTTYVLPVITGKVDRSCARRINIGGFHITNYLHRLLQLKYPAHFNAITLSRAELLVHEQCYIAEDYQEELQQWGNSDYYDQHVRRIQLPYAAPASVPGLTPEQQRERRRELARRLIEINARKREERLAEDEEQLNQLLAAQDLLDEGEDEEFQVIWNTTGVQEQERRKVSKKTRRPVALPGTIPSCKDLGVISLRIETQFTVVGAATLLLCRMCWIRTSSRALLICRKLIITLQARIERTRQKIVAANTADESITEASATEHRTYEY